jgi:hypothetical protein
MMSDENKIEVDRCKLTARDYCVGSSSIGDRSQVNYSGGSNECSTIVPALDSGCTIDEERQIYS